MNSKGQHSICHINNKPGSCLPRLGSDCFSVPVLYLGDNHHAHDAVHDDDLTHESYPLWKR